MDSSGEDSVPEPCGSPEEGALLPSNSREMRNKAEKQRRDRLNAFISELATLVPMVSRSPKKLDKTSILRLTATHLRLYQTLLHGNSLPNLKIPKQVDQNLLEQLVCDELGGFMLILTSSGKIVFVSQTIETLLGHLQTDLMGQSLFNLISAEDHDRLRLYLQCEGDVEHGWRKYFTVRIKRAGPRSETAVYEPVRMMGVHKQFTNGRTSPASSVSSSAGSATVNGDLMIFFVKICRPETFVDRLVESSKDEYITRHLIDGRIINCDQRISLVAGYMTEEVSGKSAFLYMHRDDVRWVMIALRQMYDRGESKGSSCYRLKSRNGQFIYLRTFGFLEIDSQGTVESFVCINSLVPENEGMHLTNEMKKRFSTIIPLGQDNACATIGNVLTPPPSISDSCNTDLVEDPQRVQEAVTYLMRNLPSPGGSEDENTQINRSTHSNGTRITSPMAATSSITSPGNESMNLSENEDCGFDTHVEVKSEYIELSELTPLSPPATLTTLIDSKPIRIKSSTSNINNKRSASVEEMPETTRNNGFVKRPKLSPPPQIVSPVHRPTLPSFAIVPPLIATKTEPTLYPQDQVVRHKV